MTKCSGHCRTDSSLIVQNQNKKNSLNPFIHGSIPDLGLSSYPFNPGSFPDLGPSSYPINPGSKKTQEQPYVLCLLSYV